MTKIAIPDVEPGQDIGDLDQCKSNLSIAKSYLNQMKSLADKDWNGKSKSQFIVLVDGFIRQIDDQLERATRVQTIITTVVNEYNEADRKAAGNNS